MSQPKYLNETYMYLLVSMIWTNVWLFVAEYYEFIFGLLVCA